MLWLLTGVTTVVLLVIALWIKDIARVPTAARPAALSAPARIRVSASASGAARHGASPRHRVSPATGPHVSDASSGLSYRLLSSPWRRGCPATLDTPMFSWTAGENAVAGYVIIGGSTIAWHGNACSGQLQQQFAYSGPADLGPTAMGLADALDPAYYAGVRHYAAIEDSSAMQVSGHQAWVVKFTVNYQDAAGQGFLWSSEPAAVVVIDRGAGQTPAVFYVSVPASLGASDVTALIGSLKLS